ncbi:uncharacterized protein MELLADRAFT_116363 [Melampsora larici-populina 98AG31]|uniref:Uncharacterized protein n=1 Tax=Melampsora larici-populina (strain 98AG31 / pathotype 3-4-7) TaxID=747676 RepID=F4RKG5_MELLP|nr:uncharacterized protein MELLADRAFT_116363 [Melampsora larici-populina 98AG31]EGG07092.1 hypothetical protein MELLADRAFT_116363 [Melampsora larici-populina 98AG31]
MHKNIDLSLNLLKTNHFQSTSTSNSNSTPNSKSKLQSTTTNLLNSIIKNHQNKSNNPTPSTASTNLSIKHGEDLNNFIWDYIPPRSSNSNQKSPDYDYEKRLKEIVKIYNPLLKPSLRTRNSTSRTDQLSSSKKNSYHHHEQQQQTQQQQQEQEEESMIPRSAPLPRLNQSPHHHHHHPIVSSIPKHLKPRTTYQLQIPKSNQNQKISSHPTSSSSDHSSSSSDYSIQSNLKLSLNRPRSYSTPPEPINNQHDHLDFTSNPTLQQITESDHFNLNPSNYHHHQVINEHSINKLPSSKPTSDYSSTPITPKVIRTAGSSTSSSNTTTTTSTSTEFKVLPRIGPKPNQINLVQENEVEDQTEDEEEDEMGQEAKDQEYKQVILERLPVRTSSIQESNPSLSRPKSGRVKIAKEDYVIFNKSNLNPTTTTHNGV